MVDTMWLAIYVDAASSAAQPTMSADTILFFFFSLPSILLSRTSFKNKYVLLFFFWFGSNLSRIKL